MRFDFPSLFFSHTNTRIGGGEGVNPRPPTFFGKIPEIHLQFIPRPEGLSYWGGFWGAVAPKFFKNRVKIVLFQVNFEHARRNIAACNTLGNSGKRIHDKFHLTTDTGKGIHNKLFF